MLTRDRCWPRVPRVAWLLGALAASPVARAEDACAADDATLDALNLHFGALKVLWGQLDEERFAAELAALRHQIPCLRQRLDADHVAELHMWMAFDAYLAGGRDASVDALRGFRAALEVKPGFSLPTVLLPVEHPLLALFQEAQAAPPAAHAAFDPQGRVVYVDAVRQSERAVDVPIFVQISDPAGQVLDSAYVGANELLPDLSAFPIEEPVTATSSRPPPPPAPAASSSRAPTSRDNVDRSDRRWTPRVGLDVGLPLGLDLGLQRVNRDGHGGGRLDEVGVAGEIWAFIRRDPEEGGAASVVAACGYADGVLAGPLQIRGELCADLLTELQVPYRGFVAFALQLDPPDKHYQAGAGLGVVGTADHGPLLGPLLNVGWAF